MNKGVLFATFLRIARPTNIFNMLMFIFGLPTFLAYLLYKSGDVEAFNQVLEPLFSLSPGLTMAVAFLFVSNLTGNAKSLNDGEYLALLFSRPISRASYVFSKWIACSLLVFIVVSSQMIVLTLLLHLIGCSSQNAVSWIDIVNILLNALGTTALIVMLHAFPARLGLSLFLGLLYVTFAAPLLLDLWFSKSTPLGTGLQNIVTTVCSVLRGFFFSTFDISLYLNTIHIFWLPILSFISNLALYLWIAVFVLNTREFFYANE